MSASPALYNSTVMDHFLNPRNSGDIPHADGIGEASAPGDGDRMRLTLRIRNGRIEEARFKTFGCSAAIASSSIATVLLAGRSLEEAAHFSNEEVTQALGGLPPHKIHCSVLAQGALEAALADYHVRHPQEVAKSAP